MTDLITPDSATAHIADAMFKAALLKSPAQKALDQIVGMNQISNDVIEAGIDRARRQTGFNSVPGGWLRSKWVLKHKCACCEGHEQLQKEHGKSVEHVCAERGLNSRFHTAVEAIAQILHAQKMSYRLPDEFTDRVLRGVILDALNDDSRKQLVTRGQRQVVEPEFFSFHVADVQDRLHQATPFDECRAPRRRIGVTA